MAMGLLSGLASEGGRAERSAQGARDRSRKALRRSPRAALLRSLSAVLLLALQACSAGEGDGGPGRYAARGVVEDVDRSRATVLIDHEDVTGLMPAMTMSFAVPDEAVLAGLATGQVIEFEIDFTGRSYDVVGFEVVGEASPEEGWRRLGDALVRTRPAPDFALIDQAGRPVSLATWPDRVLVVDFIFTSCPGPCPVQTANQVAIQRKLPESLRDRVQFLSITLDPEVDRPEVLARYARERGVDFANWSFLTGDRDHLAEVVRAWGVGSVRAEDGSIDHSLITFLVDDGRLMEHYTPGPDWERELLAGLLALAEARAGRDAGAVEDRDGVSG